MHVGTQGDSGGGGGGGGGFVPLRLFLLRSAVFSHFRQGLFCEQDRTYFQTSAGEEGFKTKVTFCQIHLQQEQQQRLLRLGPLGELEREILPGGEWVERGKVFLGSTSLVFPHPPERRNRSRRRKFPLLSVVIYYVYTLLFARVASWHYFFSILMLSGISENNKKSNRLATLFLAFFIFKFLINW